MARIRTIKPEFPQSESIGRLSRDARLLFVQLWTIVDDAGRARAASRMLASLLYPYDDDAPKQISKWLFELEHENMIRRYEVDGAQYLDIPKWSEHQKIDRPSSSRLPAYREPSPSPREDSRALDADLGPGPSTLDLDHSCAVANATRTDRDEVFEEFWKTYPKRDGVNPKAPARKAFCALTKSGVDARLIIDGARRCAVADHDKIGTPYIPQAVKWLRDRRWEDYQATAPPDAEPAWMKPPPGARSHEEILAGNGHAKDIGAEVRSDTGVGNVRPGEPRELQLPGGGTLRTTVGGSQSVASDDQARDATSQ